MASQECDADFVSSGNSVIETQILRRIEELFVIPPIEKKYNERL
jgi:hypothetical protein